MTFELKDRPMLDEPTLATTGAAKPELGEAIAAACNRIAPLWPLKHFVAVNPFLGFTGGSFAEAAATLRRVARTDMLPSRAFYRQAMAEGVLTDADLAAAAPGEDPGVLKARIATDAASQTRPGVVATVSEVLDRLADGDRQLSRTQFMIDEIAKFCAAWFDEGQAAWKAPTRALPLYAGWYAQALIDRNPQVMGVSRFRETIAGVPAEPRAAIAHVLAEIGIPRRCWTDYMHRALFDIGGWAGYVRYLVWNNALYGRADDRLEQLLAIRLVWGYALFRERDDAAFRNAWSQAMAQAALLPPAPADDPDLSLDLTLQAAYEHAWQRRLAGKIGAPRTAPPQSRPVAQAAFCIDVRSEVFRRALEAVSPVKTTGFAGFFGFSIEYIPIGRTTGGAQCPVLLTPGFTIRETVPGDVDAVLDQRLVRRRAAKAWKAFKTSAVSSFAFVETAGMAFAGKLVGNVLGKTRPAVDPIRDGLDDHICEQIGPTLAPTEVEGRKTGVTVEERVAMAEAVLGAMSMHRDFARLILLAGHGSSTVNNPHASGLDCGACGGHTGEANARVAVAVMNDPAVREALAAKGKPLPADSWFVAGLHDTTTDEVRLYDTHMLPPSHADDLAQLRGWLAAAGSRARRERTKLLGLPADAEDAVIARSKDWAQVRPEWGLAGNAAFIAAPRWRTQGIDLQGRAFLHDYAHEDDPELKVLTLIMTAPMVVASWINLQYYGSTVNNSAFGCGNKVLHNVTGALGVIEGNAGDLRPGLPWQSVHDGTRLIHEPLRLNVVIDAPAEAIDRVLAEQPSARELVEGGWIHLWRFGAEGLEQRLDAGWLAYR